MDNNKIQLSTKSEKDLVNHFASHLQQANDNQKISMDYDRKKYEEHLASLRDSTNKERIHFNIANAANALNSVAQVLMIIVLVLLLQRLMA